MVFSGYEFMSNLLKSLNTSWKILLSKTFCMFVLILWWKQWKCQYFFAFFVWINHIIQWSILFRTLSNRLLTIRLGLGWAYLKRSFKVLFAQIFRAWNIKCIFYKNIHENPSNTKNLQGLPRWFCAKSTGQYLQIFCIR